MGIKGLMTHMLNDSSSLKSHKLRKTNIIIDGNNLLHSIHFAHNVVWQFGGEYESFDRALVKFFDRLKICELVPFVIFDGCYDAKGSKFKTTISRFKDRIHTCSNLNKKYGPQGYLLPMLAIQTMISVLQRLQINYVTCQEEADREAAALANYLNCPIISNDSDFFIFPLNCGFIPVGKLHFIPVEEKCNCCISGTHFYMPCAIFHHSYFHLMSSNNALVNGQLMPLFSALMGNDFLSINFFDIIFMQNSNRRQMKKSTKISTILKWLHQFEDVDSAVANIIACVNEDERIDLELVLRSCISQYDLSGSDLVEGFKSNPGEPKSDCESRTFDHVKLGLNSGLLSPILVNAMSSGNVFLTTYVESVQRASIHLVSMGIRSRYYQELCRLAQKSNGTISEYMRKGKNISKTKIDIQELDSIVNLGDVYDFLLDSDRDSFINWMISHWVKMSDKTFMTYHMVLGVVVSVFVQLAWQQELEKPGTGFHKQRYENQNYKFFRDPVISNVNKFQVESVHVFNELQSVYFSFVQLLCLTRSLEVVRSLPSPQDLFCGKLSYNLIQDFKKRKNCWNYACQLLDFSPCNNIKAKFIDLISAVGRIWPEFGLFISKSNNKIQIS